MKPALAATAAIAATTILLLVLAIALSPFPTANAFGTLPTRHNRHRQRHRQRHRRQPTTDPEAVATRIYSNHESHPKASSNNNGNNNGSNERVVSSFDDAVANRYACTRYQRHDGNHYESDAKEKPASPPDPEILGLAREALKLSTRAPTGFNVQPYKLLLVESVAAKQALSRYCIGRNKDRVLDSDCSVVFLADRQSMSSWGDYKRMLLESPSSSSGRYRAKSGLGWIRLRALTGLFSSGLPLPKWIAGPVSCAVRFAMRVVSWFARSWLVVPTLSNPECWSQKNTMLVASAYVLGCSSRGLATTPMEGYLSWGIRSSLGIPRKYTIPLIVSTGVAYRPGHRGGGGGDPEDDDAGMSHGTTPATATPRFPSEDVIYENGFP